MRRIGRVPVLLVVLVLVAVLVGHDAGPSSADVGESVFASVSGVVGVAATPGRLYVTTSSCAVLMLDDRGWQTIATLTPPPGQSSCGETYVAIAGPKDPSGRGFPTPTLGGFLTNYVYVTQGQNIIEFTDAGRIGRNPFATIPACQSDRTGITFDHVGTFGYRMIATCLNGTVWTVGPNGAVSPVADVAAALGLRSVTIENPDVAPLSFGEYGGQLFVAAPDLDRVIAISPSVPSVVTRVARWRTAEGINFVPSPNICVFGASTAAYFTAIAPSSLYQFPASAFSGQKGNAIVTSGTNGGMGLLTPTRIRSFHDSLGPHEGSAFVDCYVPRIVGLRVDPGGNTPKSINPRSSGTTAFVILSSASLNAAAPGVIDQATITFGYRGTEPSLVPGSCDTTSPRDVDGDGRADLICRAYNNKMFFPEDLTVPPLNPSGTYSGRLIVKFRYTAPGGIDPDGEGFD